MSKMLPRYSWERAVLDSDLPSNSRFICLVLATYSSKSQATCFPSTTTIRKDTGLARSTVFDHLQQLEKSGWICRENRKRQNGSAKSNLYALNIPPSDDRTRGVSQLHHPRPMTGPLEPSIEQTNEQTNIYIGEEKKSRISEENGKPPIPTDKLHDVYCEIYDAAILHGISGPRPALTDTRKKKYSRLWDEQLKERDDPLTLFRQICINVTHDDFLSQNTNWLYPESFLKNAERRERWTVAALTTPRSLGSYRVTY